MISDRTRGIQHLTVLTQCVAVTVVFWVWLGLCRAGLPPEPGLVSRYLVYNEFLLLGILVNAAFFRSRTVFVRPTFELASRYSLRQLSMALFYLFIYLVALRDKSISRMFLFSYVPVLYAVFVGTNLWLPTYFGRRLFQGTRQERVLVLGSGRTAHELTTWLAQKEHLGLAPIGLLTEDAHDVAVNEGDPFLERLWPVLGRPCDLERVIADNHITKVVIAEIPADDGTLQQHVAICERLGLRLLLVSDLAMRFGRPVALFEDQGLFFIGLREEPLESPFNRIVKRALDIAVSLPVTLCILPGCIALVWLLQRFQSPGPLFYRQARTGMLGRPFTIIKFRTMHVANPDEAQQATADDPRIYPAGRWLRRFSIDELPQFLNVLRGDMSVVGPRPHLAEHNEAFARVMGNYRIRAFVKPGITGLAQVLGYRGETKTETDVARRVEADIRYLETWSLWLDCWLIVRTAMQMVLPPRTAV